MKLHEIIPLKSLTKMMQIWLILQISNMPKMDPRLIGLHILVLAWILLCQILKRILPPTPRWSVTRFNPGNAHVYGLSRHGALVGSGELDGDQTKTVGHGFYPGSAPLVG
jgi:hypothetical protein